MLSTNLMYQVQHKLGCNTYLNRVISTNSVIETPFSLVWVNQIRHLARGMKFMNFGVKQVVYVAKYIYYVVHSAKYLMSHAGNL